MSIIRFTSRYPSLFNNFSDNDILDRMRSSYLKPSTTLPSVNIMESQDDFEVELAAPGLSKDDFRIEIDHELLTISSSREEANDGNENKSFSLREFSYQSFSRSFTLPNIADNSRIGASYENGILRVTIPKKEEAKPKPPRRIDIS